MIDPLSGVASDIAALRAAWGTARGGWRAARQDAHELVVHRRVSVATSAMMPDGMVPVLRTRLRIIGDAQTDVLRGWLETASPEAMKAATDAHFRKVAAAFGGWAVARAMERLLLRTISLLGGAVGAVTVIREMLAQHGAAVLGAVLMDPWFWGAIALPLAAMAVRMVLRWRLRRMFRRGLAGRSGGA